MVKCVRTIWGPWRLYSSFSANFNTWIKLVIKDGVALVPPHHPAWRRECQEEDMSFPLRAEKSLLQYLLMQTLAHGVPVLWMRPTNSHRLQKSYGEKGTAWPLSEWERRPRPLPGQAFIAFLGTLHQRWSSFIMHRFALGGNLLQITKERKLLITAKKKDICKCKGKSGWTGCTCPWEV